MNVSVARAKFVLVSLCFVEGTRETGLMLTLTDAAQSARPDYTAVSTSSLILEALSCLTFRHYHTTHQHLCLNFTLACMYGNSYGDPVRSVQELCSSSTLF